MIDFSFFKMHPDVFKYTQSNWLIKQLFYYALYLNLLLPMYKAWNKNDHKNVTNHKKETKTFWCVTDIAVLNPITHVLYLNYRVILKGKDN